VDEEEREDEDVGISILHGAQHRGTYGMASRGLLPAVMWSRTKARVRPGMPHHIFRPAAFLFVGGGSLSSYLTSSWLLRLVKNAVHWSSLLGPRVDRCVPAL
jgi:hypothetical protein